MEQPFFKKIFSVKIVTVGILLIFVLCVVLFLFSGIFLDSVDTTGISEHSSIKQTKDTLSLSLHKDSGYLYKTKKTGLSGVKEFLGKNPSFTATQPQDPFQRTKEVITGTVLKKSLFAGDILKNLVLLKTLKDADDPFLKKQKITLTSEHYVFGQTIQGVPVYGASLTIHVKNQNEIYDITGSLLTTQDFEKQSIQTQQAEKIALEKARQEAAEVTLKVTESKPYIVNKKLLGISEDAINYTTLSVMVERDGIPRTFSKEYFVDLASGEIIYEEEHVLEAKNREIYNCRNNSQCPDILERAEGASAVSDTDVNSAYDRLGEIYDYYKNSFDRDSIDNRGIALKGYVNFPGGGGIACPNAFWDGYEMVFCKGLVAKDITAHEMTHAIVQYTAGLAGGYQSSALNESIADIFGSALDGNWTMGEGSAIGTIRNMANPPAVSHPQLGPQADRLFSQYYYCGAADQGGVHQNNGVVNKAFYLLTEGGNFNGCSVQGVGREKAHAMIYRVLYAAYLHPAANFKTMYSAVQKACNDLYAADSETCLAAKKSFQATETDQQPEGSQFGARCSGVQVQVPECARSSPGPITITPSVNNQPTSVPTQGSVASPPIITPIVSQPPPSSSGDASITTDKQSYQLNEAIQICYTVPGSGPIKIIDLLPNGTSQVFLEGLDDGRGDCLNAIVTPPTGRECLRLEYTVSSQAKTVQTCFDVGVSSQPQNPSLVTPIPTTHSGNQKDSKSFFGNPVSSSPSPSSQKNKDEFECHEKTEIKDENGRQVQISSLECKPI